MQPVLLSAQHRILPQSLHVGMVTMKSTNIISAAVATHGVVNAAALPIPPDETAKQDSTVEEFDNPAWWGKEKRDLTVESIDKTALGGKEKRATNITVEAKV
ncbi:af9cd9b5-94e9-4f3f-a880-14ed4685f315 [Thermothielavioides terrestris]|uniref:Af9cd9b5-94e9-4f3f-a880-14ed4685f315 n=1 Tax=Thermothielavioides terrestris TaxID=2587410 RepID=A0A446BLT9_9PEZI|nr:af9cd9b5-94e9-4f3f-a880-14ed4685f315 [Thermothielavioides terrestris]